MGGNKKAGDKKVRSSSWCSCSSICNVFWKCAIFISLVGTNLLALYSLTSNLSYDTITSKSFFSTSSTPLQVTGHISRVHHELQLAQLQLAGIRNDLSSFLDRLRQQQPHQTDSAALAAIKLKQKPVQEKVEMLPDNVNDNFNLLESIPSSELQEFIAPRDLPLGKHKLFKISKVASSVGHACSRSEGLLQTFMDYDVGGACPDDPDVARSLLLQGCEPLPRRRCFAKSSNSSNLLTPLRFPSCLWSLPPNDAILWTGFSCKGFDCLIANKLSSLDLDKERHRWVQARDEHDIVIGAVLALKKGSIRIGLDLGGESGSFAARMREMDVTIVTTTLDVEAPWGSIVAARGLVAMDVTISQRLPFFDNTMDIVHSVDLLGAAAMPIESFEFLLYDLDRILRTGGLLWIEKLSCSYDLLHKVYIPAIQRMSYDKVRWFTDNGDSNQAYLTALLEKPIRDEAE